MSTPKLKDEAVLWNIYTESHAATKEERLSKRSARGHVISVMADIYQIPPESINEQEEPVLHANVSKIIRLIFPKDAGAAANLRREIDRGRLSFHDALVIANGNAQSREECSPQVRGVPADSLRRFALAPLFGAIVAAARQGGYETAEIRSAFNDALRDSECEDD